MQSIYPDIIESRCSTRMTLRMPVDATGGQVTLRLDDDIQKSQAPDPPMVKLQHLPPVLLSLSLTPNYPESEPPCICAITSVHSWLSGPLKQSIKDNLKELWHPGEPVLCTWIDYIISAEFLQRFGGMQITGSSARILLSYSESAIGLKFLEQAFTCLICQRSVKGSGIVQLSCDHAICRSCLSAYWTYTIQQGDINHTCCPDADCMKKGRAPRIEELEVVLPPELIQRWHFLHDKWVCERDPAATYCPIPSCQSSVLGPVQIQHEESGWTWLRTCPRCSFSFCALCRRTWHGPHTSCAESVTSQIVGEYQASEGDPAQRLQLERRYGRARLRKLVAQYEEDQLNEKILTSSTMMCPGCKIRIEKSMGCNHITCLKCKQHFCYLCGQKIDSTNPYGHFSNMGSGCYGRLFSEIPDEVPAELLIM